jgi:hypothetical protein
MERRNRMRGYRRVLGTALAVLGMMVWTISATLRVTPREHSDVSIGHIEDRLVGVIAGGALVAGGVILLVTAV